MFYVHLIATVLSVAGVPGVLLRLLPLKAQTAHPLLPLLMLLTAIGGWYLPTGLGCAVASIVPASYLINLLGIEVVPAEGADWSPAKKATVQLAERARGMWDSMMAKIATVSRLRVVRAEKPADDPEPHPAVAAWIARGAQGVVDTAPNSAPDGDVDGGDAEEVADEPETPKEPAEKFDWRAKLKEVQAAQKEREARRNPYGGMEGWR